jgi:hypothetical protein
MAKEDRYYIAVCEVTYKDATMTVERLGHAWGLSLQLETPVTGKLVKMRECTKEEWFSA